MSASAVHGARWKYRGRAQATRRCLGVDVHYRTDGVWHRAQTGLRRQGSVRVIDVQPDFSL